MATILELTDVAIARIKERLVIDVPALPVDVQRLPLDPAKIGIATPRAQVWFAWKSGSYTPPESITSNPHKPVSMRRSLEFEALIQCQQLQNTGHEAIYALLQSITDALSGWMPQSTHLKRGLARPFFPTREGFVQFGNGLWLYSQGYSIETTYSPPHYNNR